LWIYEIEDWGGGGGGVIRPTIFYGSNAKLRGSKRKEMGMIMLEIWF